MIIAYICFITYSEFFEFIRVRQEFLLLFHHNSSIYVNIVFVIDILKNIFSIERFFNVFRNLLDEICQVWINQDYRNLIKQIEKRESFINILKSTKTIWLKKLVTKKTNKIKIVNQHDEMKNEKLWNRYLNEIDRDIKHFSIFDFN